MGATNRYIFYACQKVFQKLLKKHSFKKLLIRESFIFKKDMTWKIFLILELEIAKFFLLQKYELYNHILRYVCLCVCVCV